MNTASGRVNRPFTVVVGVSTTSRSVAALRWAVQEARHHDGVVIALRAWRPPRVQLTVEAAPGPDSSDSSEISNAKRELESDVAEVLGQSHDVECRLVQGGRRKAMRSISRYADLLVIDAPQRSDLSSPPLFARRLIYTARCPVVVMPPAVADQPDTPIVAAGKRIGGRLLESAGSAGRPGIRPAPHPGSGDASQRGAGGPPQVSFEADPHTGIR